MYVEKFPLTVSRDGLYKLRIRIEQSNLLFVSDIIQAIDSAINSVIKNRRSLEQYILKNPVYKVLPNFKTNCLNKSKKPMAFIYPKDKVSVFLPKDFDGKTNDIILKIAHSTTNIKVYWYLNKKFIGTTQNFHEIAIQPKKGKHIITVVDEFGNEIKRFIEIKE